MSTTTTTFEIESSALPDNARVVAVRGSEGISRPYIFDVYVNVVGTDEVEIDDAPGAKATLIITSPEGAPSRWGGMIATMELRRAGTVDGELASALYLVRIVPHLFQLSLSKHSRIWTKKTIPEIIQEVLSEEGVDQVDVRLNGSYDAEEHVCQYKESSLNFIHRWMEREGIYYFFEQTESGETLVLTDDKATSTASLTTPVPYNPGGDGDVSRGAHFDAFTWRHDVTPATIRYTDYDYAKPALDVKGSADVSPIGLGEQVTYGSRFFTPKQGDALATIRAQDLRAQAKTFHGSGPVRGISSGSFFSVANHPRLQLNMEYLAVSVEHYGRADGSVRKTWGKALPHDYDEVYRVDVVAIDATQQYRHPELAVWPRLDGYENAVVDGPAKSDYAQIDDQGRYNLKFKFDEGTLKGGKASTWVRKMQPHAGTVEGWHFPERAGTEVICAFLGGDPDRPIIVGAIPTMIHPSPVTQANHTKNVIQTGGKNRYEMEDQAGQQRVTISTPTQKSFFHIGSPLTGMSQVFTGEGDSGGGATKQGIVIEDHHAAIVSDGNSLIMTCGNQDITSGGNWRVDIAGNHVETIAQNRVDTVSGYMEQSITGKLDQDVHGPVSEEYHNTYSQGVQGAATIKHATTLSHGVGCESEGGATHSLKVAGTQKVTVTGATHWETGPVTWEIGTSLDITVKGPKKIESTEWHETIKGPKSEAVLGWKQDFVLGPKTDEVVGLRMDISAIGKIDICAAASLEIAPEALSFKLVDGHIHSEKTEATAMENKLSAIEGHIDGLKKADAAIIQGATMLAVKTETLESKVSTLTSTVAGLHSKM